jgi:hypothetical protein
MEEFLSFTRYRPMNEPTTDLAAGLSALEETFRQLRPRLAEIVEQIGDPGRAPAEETISQLVAARKEFVRLRDALLQRAAAEQVASTPSPEQIASLPQLGQLLRQVTEAQTARAEREKRRDLYQRAAQVLDRVLGVAHRERPDFAPLANCQGQARELRQAAAALDEGPREQLERLAEGHHPLCDLLTLLESYRVIDDARWQQLHDSIAQHFGRDLALAIIRGRLCFRAPAAPAPTPAAPPVAPTPVATAPPETPRTVPEVFNGEERTLVNQSPVTEAALAAQPEEDPMIVDEASATAAGRHGPLSVQQVSDLLTPSNGVAVLFGAPLAGLDDVEEQLHAAGREGRLITLDGATDRMGFLRELEELQGDRPDGLILVLVPSYCAWNEDWVRHAQQHLRPQPGKKKVTRVVFMADPAVTWYWVQMSKNVRDRLHAGGVAEFSLQPLAPATVAAWLEERGLGPADAAMVPKIAQVTGNWALLLSQFAGRSREHPDRWEQELTALEKELAAGRSSWRNSLGVVPQALPVLKAMSEFGEPVTAAELAELLAGSRAAATIEAVLRWAELLAFIRPVSPGKWKLDRMVGQAIGQLSEEWEP